LQEREFKLAKEGFKAVKHQSFVGTEYFDAVQNTVQQGNSSTTAMHGSTEADQFKH
jgi:isocitrate lyase